MKTKMTKVWNNIPTYTKIRVGTIEKNCYTSIEVKNKAKDHQIGNQTLAQITWH